MAQIRPFKAYRPCKGMEERIAALPYDVYNRAEACEVVKKNPESFLAIDRAETQFGEEVDTYADCVYEKADQMLREKILEGKFVQDPTPCFYLYELTMDGNSQTGVVGCASIDDYRNNVIKKHENTRADKEEDRIRHVDTCSMQTGPIFLAYRAKEDLKEKIGELKKQTPVYDFVSEDGIGHRVWVIDNDSDVAMIEEAFGKIPAIYIADGHNRVVKDLNGMDAATFLTRIEEYFAVEKKGQSPYRPTEKGTFGMYLENEWYSLSAKEEIKSEDAVEGLDVSLLQNDLLDPILGIMDPKTDKRIDFVGGIRGLGELERRVHTDMNVAFSMYPTSIAELFAVADAGRLMPPKSTWFEPKLRSGLFLHEIER